MACSPVNERSRYGINGKFTNRLSESGMYRNCSLNTVEDKERVNGSKDWMEHLNS